jgi:hypothetical protein
MPMWHVRGSPSLALQQPQVTEPAFVDRGVGKPGGSERQVPAASVSYPGAIAPASSYH